MNEAGKFKRGSADTVFGRVVIEFERDLKKTGAHAEDQLREYVAGMWQKHGKPVSLAAVATNGIEWRTSTRSCRRAVRWSQNPFYWVKHASSA